jgi:chemotaxis family two-component system response regulator Rcp1
MPGKSAHRSIEILMVEDNPGDVRLTREALKDSKVLNALHVVEDGVAALDFLHRRPPYQAVPRPDLILLDLTCRAWTAAQCWRRSSRTPC